MLYSCVSILVKISNRTPKIVYSIVLASDSNILCLVILKSWKILWFLWFSKKYCFIRTLISNNTHLSKYLYSDSFDKNGDPDHFVYENTYSKEYIKQIIRSHGNYNTEFIEDKFDEKAINAEFVDYDSIQDAVTKSVNGLQIAGSKVFEWAWVKITKWPIV